MFWLVVTTSSGHMLSKWVKYFKLLALFLKWGNWWVKWMNGYRFGSSWHVVIGEDFGLEVSHEMQHVLYAFFRQGTLGACAWKCPWYLWPLPIVTLTALTFTSWPRPHIHTVLQLIHHNAIDTAMFLNV